ncbi:MAG: hypothetical protein WCK60_01225 [Candidatus Nomurabacteria bacterium]
MGRKKGAVRASTPETAEKNAVAYHRACMCGCGKGCSGYKDEPRDGTEKLDELTSGEVFQQQQGLFAYADPVDVLIASQEGAPGGLERRSAQRE